MMADLVLYPEPANLRILERDYKLDTRTPNPHILGTGGYDHADRPHHSGLFQAVPR